ncbi:endolytic transglycosylase MltG [uncultured Nitrospira sp.]|uniref:endolytic transglycosylase MltG n=1 Tax=uncultured Nitrospira sp. TaxID=157176 RepID=UPI0031407517
MILVRRRIVSLLSGVVLVMVGFMWLNQPVGGLAQRVLVEIPPGTPFTQVSDILDQHHLIGSGWFFTFLGRVQRVDRNIIPGEYELNAGMQPTELLNKLVKGKVYQYAITIPEGYNVAQIADILDQKRLALKQDIFRLSRDPVFIQSLNVHAPTLEGYLFPDTYHFSRFTPPESIIRTFVNRFHDVLTPELKARTAAMDMTLQEVLTLASVVEKETGLAAERPLVSGVFHNRLRRGIPLQSDPTVIYALESFDGNIRKTDLSVDSPYNTYKVRGLPPGPIANPGLAAIHAALYPTQTDFVYFVSRNDGSHQFSVTLADHNKAVDIYQRRLTGKRAS